MTSFQRRHPAALPPDELLAECAIRFVRRSGPGGQHRNKVSTGVVLLHEPSGAAAEAGERRSQAENRTVALFRLRIQLALDVRSDLPSPFGRGAGGEGGNNLPAPSPLWQSRVIGGKIAVSAAHDDFPALLAEALDALADSQFEPKPAAERLHCTASQLVKFLRKEPRAILQVNRLRAKLGKHPLQ